MFARSLALLLFLSLCIVPTVNATDAGNGSTVLVIPARYTVVQLAFDVAYLRPVALLAYDSDDAGEPLLHRWSTAAGDWIETDMDACKAGTATSCSPGRVVVLASGTNGLPASLAEAAGAWCDDVTVIPSLRSLTVLNTLHDDMKFSAREWKWLAGRHGLTLKDLNAERRRYGRYGKPGAKKTAPVIESEIPAPTQIDEPPTTGEAAEEEPAPEADIPPEHK